MPIGSIRCVASALSSRLFASLWDASGYTTTRLDYNMYLTGINMSQVVETQHEGRLGGPEEDPWMVACHWTVAAGTPSVPQY
jgi:hypothetical protein